MQYPALRDKTVLRNTLLVTSLLCLSSLAYSGTSASFNSPAPVTDANSAMYTVDDVYYRLNAGTAGTKRTTTFAEPTAAPAASSKNLNEVMGKAPVLDDATGAATTDVTAGKTFWSLQSGTWGLQTGSATTPSAGNNVSGANGSKTFTIPDGLYSGSKTATANDSNLTAANIKKDTIIFGVTGTAEATINPAVVPKTGQNLCYKTDGTTGIIDCTGTKQDGDLQAGIAHSSPRFTGNMDGVVIDNTTGLIWLKNANCAQTSGFDLVGGGRITWAQAYAFIAELNAGNRDCGDISNTGGTHQTDWRLPNINELYSLIDFQYETPALANTAGTAKWVEGNPFSSVESFHYWSSTTLVGSNSAWYVNLGHGNFYYRDKVGTFAHYAHVWPVRGGQ